MNCLYTANSIVTPSAAYYDQVVTIACAPGFELSEEGSATPKCGADGQYSPEGKRCKPAACKINECERFSRAIDGFYKSFTVDPLFATAYVVTCEEGYSPFR